MGVFPTWGRPLGGLLNLDHKCKIDRRLRFNDIFEMLAGIGGGDSEAYFPDLLGDQKKSWCAIGVVLHGELVVRNCHSVRFIGCDVEKRLVQAATKIVVTVVVTNTTSKGVDSTSESHEKCLVYRGWPHDK